jgi:hypothetical protein
MYIMKVVVCGTISEKQTVCTLLKIYAFVGRRSRRLTGKGRKGFGLTSEKAATSITALSAIVVFPNRPRPSIFKRNEILV